MIGTQIHKIIIKLIRDLCVFKIQDRLAWYVTGNNISGRYILLYDLARDHTARAESREHGR